MRTMYCSMMSIRIRVYARVLKCKVCERQGQSYHHIFYKSATPALKKVANNMIVLCRDCHAAIHSTHSLRNYDTSRFDLGFIIGQGKMPDLDL